VARGDFDYGWLTALDDFTVAKAARGHDTGMTCSNSPRAAMANVVAVPMHSNAMTG
jgi:hypothetical protein